MQIHLLKNPETSRGFSGQQKHLLKEISKKTIRNKSICLPRGPLLQGGLSGFSKVPPKTTPKDPPSGGWVCGAVLGGQKRQNLKSIFEKPRVGFGSPELSLRLSCTELCALSSGDGPRGLGFHGGPSGEIFVFVGGHKCKKI